MSNLRNPQYDAWLFWAPTYQCNLDCDYCFLEPATRHISNHYNINISALKKTLNCSNKIYRITFSGGEPFLASNIVEACIELTRKHFIAFNSNLTSKKVKEFAEKINPSRVLFILASCHIKTLERRNLLSRYIDNFLLCKNRGFPIFAMEVGYPPLLKEVEKYKKFFLEKGIDLTFSPYMGRYKGKSYPDSYSEKELKIFGLEEFNIKQYYQHGQFCNVGYNVGLVKPNGDISYCIAINKSLGNIYEGIKFKNKLVRCPSKFCNCPVNIYDPYLFRKAISEVGSYAAEWIQPFKNRIKDFTKNLIYNYLKDNTRKLIIEIFMRNKFFRKYLLKNWI
ncbi:MAG: radical SAM protein [Candidatus Hermodarchaeota archaeon]